MEYQLRMSRRDYIKDEEDKLESQFYLINYPKRWEESFIQVDPVGPDGQPEIPITDPRQLDRWFDTLAAQQGMTAAQAEQRFLAVGDNRPVSQGPHGPAAHLLGFAEGEGKRV